MKIYLISLESDLDRRMKLKKNIPRYYGDIEWDPAVVGRDLLAGDYFKLVINFQKIHNRLLTCGEIGCALSHINVLKKFVESNEKQALILEDDIVGTDINIDEIISIAKNLPEKSILFCGGQISTRKRKYQLGKKTCIENVYQLSKFSYSYVFGTCCYVVTRQSALQILSVHIEYLKIADQWDLFFKKTDFKLFYSPILEHPDDMLSSNIDSERKLLHKPENLYQRLRSGRFFRKNLNLLINYFIVFILLLCGYRKIP